MSEHTFNIQEIFKNISSQMKNDFERARIATSHPGIKGDNAEEIVKTFLRQYLPKNLDITSGIIIDSDGNSSKQCDIIIADASSTPILFENKDARVVPVEPVYAVIEVKSILTSDIIPSIIENMLSVKKLNKKAYYKDMGIIETVSYHYDKKHEISPILYFFFAFEAIKPWNFCNDFIQEFFTRKLDITKRIDCGCILNSMVYANRGMKNRTQIDALPYEDSILLPIETKHPLLLFYTLIANYLNQARCPRFKFNDYISKKFF